jgi:nucleotide-binding universal stress UspA family protein
LLVPLDGSELSECALATAVELATQLRADVLLVQVVPLPYVFPGVAETEAAALEQQLAEVRTYLESVARRTEGSATGGPTISFRAEASPTPATTIARVAQDEHADMIVMATHGRSGVERLVLGSVANGVLRHSTVPLLLVHPHRPIAAQRARP